MNTIHESASIIDSLLDALDRTRESLLFLVGDNCPTNTALADLLRIPFVGCSSHRFALEVRAFTDESNRILTQLDSLFRELRKVKNSIVLRNITPLRPLKRNATRWSSAVPMIRRHLQYIEISVYEHFGSDVGEYVMSFNQNATVKELSKASEYFENISKCLQNEDTSILSAKAAFTVLHEGYPFMNNYTKYSPPNDLIHSPHFECDIVKIMEVNDPGMNWEEKEAVKCFLKPNNDPPVSASSTVKSKLKALSSTASCSRYVDLSWIPATSNVVECLFSRTKLTVGCLRTRLTSDSLEKQLFLLYNRSYWDESTIKSIICHRPFVQIVEQ
ncbi:hypothetical protein GEMRC1_010717 [Eukaryota sp. GEM-RC1]